MLGVPSETGRTALGTKVFQAMWWKMAPTNGFPHFLL